VINVNLKAVFMAMKTEVSAIKASGDTETRMMSTCRLYHQVNRM
jgi:predicted PP-loop superfamily ATPase